MRFQYIQSRLDDNEKEEVKPLPPEPTQQEVKFSKLEKPPRTLPVLLKLQIVLNKSVFILLLLLSILMVTVNLSIFTDTITLPFSKIYTVIVAAPIGIALSAPLLFLILMGIETIGLLRNGIIAKAKVSDLEENPDEKGAGRMMLKFKTRDGKYIERPFATKKIDIFKDTQYRRVFYNPDKPERFWALDDFPPEIDINETGKWKTPDNSASVYPIISIFLGTLVFSQLYQLLRAFIWVFR